MSTTDENKLGSFFTNLDSWQIEPQAWSSPPESKAEQLLVEYSVQLPPRMAKSKEYSWISTEEVGQCLVLNSRTPISLTWQIRATS
jgi:hypothetical protein